MRRNGFFLAISVFLGVGQAVAQYPEDALRLSTPGVGVGARALGMGGAYVGVSSDFNAIYYNPAGLAQMKLGEFSMGLSYLNTQDQSSFYGTSQTASSNAFSFNSFGVVYPIPARKGSLVFAFGFQRQANFSSALAFSGFNPESSIIQSWAPDGQPLTPEISIAEHLWLAQADTINKVFISPIRDRVTQTGNVAEAGGLNNWSVAGAMDFGPNLSAGATFTYVAGSYRYDRRYREEDRNGYYSTYPFDFSSLQVDEYIDQDIYGWTATFGFMYRIPERFRIGFTAKLPTAFTVHENYGLTAGSVFDDNQSYAYYSNSYTEYDVHTPWVIGGGASFILRNLVLSADMEFTDWTTMEFVNTNNDLMSLNTDIRSMFRSTWEYRLGAEYEIPSIGLRLRAGYGLRPSPYKNDPADFDRKTASGGIGILLSSSVMLDAAYSYSWWNTYRMNYAGPSRVDESISLNTVLATISYRF